jgi:glycosyltransferase involved in cell wall biosynthesis
MTRGPRVLAFIEALGVTGPAKNLLDTAGVLDLSVATYRRHPAPPPHHDGVDAFVDAFHQRGIPVTVIGERRALDPAAASAVSQTIARLRPDIVQTHNIKSHALVARATGRHQIPWVAFHHGYTSTDLKVRLYNLVDRWSLPRADAVVTTCRPFADELAHAGIDRQRITVVHNAAAGTAPMDRRSARALLGLDDAPLIVAVGRLSREKGHDVLIDACASLQRMSRDAPTLLIAGEGPEHDRLAARARRRGIKLRLDGFQASIAPYYAAADVFVLPSRSEGSPNVLLEAMAAGRPIVATSVGGVPEIASCGEVQLVPPDQPMALANAVAQVFSSPVLADRLGRRARRRAFDFTAAARNATLLDLYSRLCAS